MASKHLQTDNTIKVSIFIPKPTDESYVVELYLSTNTTLTDIISKLYVEHRIDVSIRFFRFYLDGVEISTRSDDGTIFIYRGASLQILPWIIQNINDAQDGYKYDSVKM